MKKPIGRFVDGSAVEAAANKDDIRRKFPESMDPKAWADGLESAWPEEYLGDEKSRELLSSWFQAALARGREEGKKEAASPGRRRDLRPIPESFDARDWAREFVRINEHAVVGEELVDEELMRVWFANSLMRGFEEGKKFANGSQSERALRDRAPRSPGPEAPLYLCLPDLCRVFAQTSAAYEAHRALPCPKDGFDGWQAVNAVLNQIAEAVSSAAYGVRVVWNAAPNMEENPLGEVGKFEPAGTGSGPQPSAQEPVAPEMSAPMSCGKHPLDRLKERIDQVNESFDDFRVDKQKQLAALADQGRLHERNIDALDAGLVALKSVVAQLRIDFLRGLKLANARIGVLESKSGGGWSKRLSDLEARQRALETLEGGPK